MSGHCHHHADFTGINTQYKRVLVFIILINFGMFLFELMNGIVGQSQALQADALDFLGDSMTYSLSLWAIGRSDSVRSNVAIFKAFSLIVFAVFVLGKTIYHCFFLNQPDPVTMSWVAVLALAANLLSVLLLMKYRDGDANVRSVWLCSRNDAIGNVMVIVASLLVFQFGHAWPDLLVALILSTLFFHSAILILRQSFRERP